VRRASLSLIVFLMMVGIASSVELTAAVVPGKGWAAWGCGIFLAILCAGLLQWRLRHEVETLSRTVEALPEFDPEKTRKHSDEIGDVFDAILGTSQKLQRMLAAADEDRLQLEAVLDSMQDAVVAVDAAGRIQWTNQRMQRLMPGASVSSAVRVGHALV